MNKNIESKILETPYNKDINDVREFNEGDERVSMRRLSKYEYISLLGIRTEQLKRGSMPLFKDVSYFLDNKKYEQIAEREIKNKICPYKVLRKLPNGKYEIFKLEELEILDIY